MTMRDTQTDMGMENLLKYLFDTNSIVVSKEAFTTKSGRKYFFETDLRNGIISRSGAEHFGDMLYTLLGKYIDDDTMIMGIPETGTFISMLLYGSRLSKTGGDFPINIMRSNTKEYQKGTEDTVLPLRSNQKILIVEDDVVTGDTLVAYLLKLKQLGMSKVTVVSVIDRQEIIDGLSVKDRVSLLGYSYHNLIGIDDIARRAREIGLDFSI